MTNHPVLMFIHIGMGSLALLAGAGAMTFRKGSRPHRRAGTVFFIAMLIMSALGGYLAFIEPDFGTAIMGALTFYLVATAWMTVIRKEGESGRFEIVAMLAAAALAVTALSCGLEAAASANGRMHGYPAVFYYIVAGILASMAFLDVRLILRHGIAGAQRIVRHLWRMGFALFIAAGSLFLGQPGVFPEPIRGIALRSAPVVGVIGLTIFWLVRVLSTGWYRKQAAVQDEPGIRQGIRWRGRGGAAGAPGQSAP